MKRCNTCGQSLDISYFGKNVSRKDGLFFQCRKCHSKQCKEYRNKNRDREKQRSNEHYNKNKDWINQRARTKNKNLKVEVLSHYAGGGLKCACCDDSHIEFLGIDHIDGGGTKHRIKLGHGGGALYRWLKRNGYPEGYRVLCINCNSAIGLFGCCPHERDGETETTINRKRRQ